MSCHAPLDGWRSRERNENGKLPMVFTPSQAEDSLESIPLPCGKCLGCRADQSRDWGIRCYHESMMTDHSCFITLTYADENLPSDGRINPREIKRFNDNLRYRIGHSPRFFACGEYGDVTRRPHYHYLCFGEHFKGADIVLSSRGDYTSPLLVDAWEKGQVHVTHVTQEACMYVAGYTQKKVGDPDTFSTKSVRPPLGYSFAESYLDDLRRLGKVRIGNREWPIPKVYFQWFPEELQEVKEKHLEEVRSKSSYFEDMQSTRAKARNANSPLKATKGKI